MSEESTVVNLNDFKKDYASMQEKTRAPALAQLKEKLVPIANDLQKDMDRKNQLEIELKELNKQIQEKLNSIHKEWSPFIQGTDKASLDLDNGLTLNARTTINVKVEDEDKVIEWLRGNGYEGAMKWQIHAQTRNKIAKEEYEKGNQIPGLLCNEFTVIKLKD